MKDNLLKISYLILIIIVIICAGFYFEVEFIFRNGIVFNYLVPNDFVQTFALSIATSIITIFLTVLLIDKVIEKNEKIELIKRKEIAMMQLRIPLIQHYTLLFKIFKASAKERPDISYNLPEELFNEIFFDEISHLNFWTIAPTKPDRPWIIYLCQEFNRFKEELEKTVEKYGFYLDTCYIEIVEKTIHSSCLELMTLLPSIYNINQTEQLYIQKNILAMPGMIDMVKEYCKLFTTILKNYNDNMTDEYKIKFDDSLWKNEVSPSIGSSRITD